jgi:hypothetical protein
VGEDPSALRRDVEDARAQLGDTVDALGYKVSPPRRVIERGRGALCSPMRAGAIVVAGTCVALAPAVRSTRRR